MQTVVGGSEPVNPVTTADFEGYFQELHGHSPYDWQSRLARRATEATWPGAIDLPTGSGKTACLDIAVFALACQASWDKAKRTAPRRIFFCVNRRVIVDEAYQRAIRIARTIRDAEAAPDSHPVLARAAAALRQLSGMRRTGGPPLDVLELRGGIYRDNRWARSAAQATIVCTTIDQLGSRLLFQGYGVSANAAPIQAALIAYDSLVLLDEAHISRPFLQTLDSVRRYLDPDRWGEQRLGGQPMIAVPMTATPPDGVNKTDVIRLEAEDRRNASLDGRLKASKPAKLLSVSDIVECAVAEAGALASRSATAVGIIVNRVARAKEIYDSLRASHSGAVVELVIGSMRPTDRDRQAERLRQIVGPGRPELTTETSFVVATQCLEVGADYDFDALVTECASLDALRQRFGRLNRGGRFIEARAVILIDSKQAREESQLDDTKPLDPIYGNALSRTWNCLHARADVLRVQGEPNAAAARRRRPAKSARSEMRQVDFGIDAFNAILRDHGEDGGIPASLLAPSASRNAPVMLPAYVDIWCQTSPRASPNPEASLFIHGPQSGEADVQVCWRADLVEEGQLKKSDWCDIVGLLPPTAAECMSVPISRLRRWLSEESDNSDQGDLLGASDRRPTSAQTGNGIRASHRRVLESRVGVLWRGLRDSEMIRKLDVLRPGDTIVLPASAEGWNQLGHIPADAPIDVAESAFCTARDRAILRLHPVLRAQLPDAPTIAVLLERIADRIDPPAVGEIRQLLRAAAADPAAVSYAEVLCRLADHELGLLREDYPDGCGMVLATRRRVGSATAWCLPIVDEGEDEYSRTTRQQPVGLAEHTQHVQDEVTRVLAALPFDDLSEVYRLAANWHDLGKGDERFQAMLRRTDRTDAWLFSGVYSALLAKSDGMPQTPQQRREACERAGLPEGFRHETLSVQIAERITGSPADHGHRDLILHLIAAHHGYARPFVPVVIDDEPPDVLYVAGVELSGEDRRSFPPHRIDSGIAERFWSLTRRYGWWGLAYLEAILRLADQQASADEDAGTFGAITSSPALGGAVS